ncbi:MAG: cysteine desulfurase family protein [bacterium]|nr:cysteine desulfurase family protein [bacterium]
MPADRRLERYLDHAATSPPRPEVTAAVREAMEVTFGNPSSLHRKGLEAERALTRAREEVAGAVGAGPGEIVFTSGGTESNNLAIRGALRGLDRRGRHLITTAVEHPAVLSVARDLEQDGYRLTVLAPDARGVISVDDLGRALAPDTVLVSIMAVNNEVGSIQPIAEAARLLGEERTKGPRPVLHVDAAQALGRIPLNVGELGADLVSFSAHKLGGPKGVGALYVKRGTPLRPLLAGGGQEGGLRSGTENVPAIAGFGVAAHLAAEELPAVMAELAGLRHRLTQAVREQIPGSRLNGPPGGEPAAGLARPGTAAPHIVNFSFPGAPGEVLLHYLEEEGIYVSTGAACSSRKRGRSHVLEAMGLAPEEIDGAIRVSLGPRTTAADVDALVEALARALADIRRFTRR